MGNEYRLGSGSRWLSHRVTVLLNECPVLSRLTFVRAACKVTYLRCREWMQGPACLALSYGGCCPSFCYCGEILTKINLGSKGLLST